MTRRRYLLGLIGANIQRSLSPALHEDALAAAGLGGHYHLIDIERPASAVALARLLDAVRVLGFAGVNVTHPCKESILPLLDQVAPEAAEVGAVNTVVIDDRGRTSGANTDRPGFAAAVDLALGRGQVAGRAVLLIGAGGAGRAVAHALFDLGAAAVAVHDADHDRAETLALSLRRTRGRAHASLDPAEPCREVAGVVNATPVGMAGHPGQPLPSECLRPELWVADIVYTPLETQLVAAARRRGCRVMTGGGMCVHQAAAAFRLFTGVAPDVARMQALFDRLCRQRDAGMAAAG